MDVAEQSLTALEMLSRRHGKAILQAVSPSIRNFIPGSQIDNICFLLRIKSVSQKFSYYYDSCG